MNRSLPSRSRGTAAIEFMMVLPLVLMLLLLTMQVAFMLQAWIVVHHAAQTAARSAMVAVPSAMADRASGLFEGANQVLDNRESPKHRFTRRAAALALAPISPGLVTGLTLGASGLESVAEAAPGLAAMAGMLPSSMTAGQSVEVAQRIAYAQDPSMTEVRLTIRPASGPQPATVNVRLAYKYYLAVPFGDRMFGTPYPGMGWLAGARFRELVAEYAMPVDMVPVFPSQLRPGMYFEEEILQ